MVENIRGDVTVTIAGEPFVLKPTWEVMLAICTACGAGVLEIRRLLAVIDPHIVVTVLRTAILTSGYKAEAVPDYSTIGQALLESFGDEKGATLAAPALQLMMAFGKKKDGEPTGKKPAAMASPSPTT